MKKAVAAIVSFAVASTASLSTTAQSMNHLQSDLQTLLSINSEVECLAKNIYFETHASSLADAMSVSDVVLNRVESTRYPNTICEVVQQGYRKGRRDCQFSWYCDGKSDNPRNQEAWTRSLKFANDMYSYGAYRGITEGSTHYHATYVKPYWAPSLDRVGRIGAHIFYRAK